MDDDAILASDDERSSVVTRLQQAQADGRLLSAEFSERLARAAVARTRGDLRALTTDLPPATAPAVPAPTANPRAGLRWMWRLWLAVNLLCFGIWLIIALASDGGAGYPWFLWVAGPWGAVLLVKTLLGERGNGA